MKTFAEQLRHFAESVQFLSPSRLEELRSALFNYLKNATNASVVEVCTSTTINDRPGLAYVWFSGWPLPSPHEILRDKGYYGQTSFAFDKTIRLWIVAVDQGVNLRDA